MPYISAEKIAYSGRADMYLYQNMKHILVHPATACNYIANNFKMPYTTFSFQVNPNEAIDYGFCWDNVQLQKEA